ncbi:hypothetical protein [Desulfosporosinus sp. OT]|uniref:hypothetical protein n=1 Tax=Desulfosporosinus sp. OT TaxID=913865 RepID=UPI000223AA8B|nr:hypothetical protein [Desulfosporosinus sp. OT]EGW38889.1 hypothetical protein DOT_3064 [Desulfosporosinus sp. OT]
MFLLGVVLCLGILLWRTNSSLEWNIPLKWQILIGAWQRECGNKTHSLNYVCYLGSENSELEKDFWHLRMALPRMQKKFKVPLWIKVRIHQGVATKQKDLYLACLQKRFPEIEIDECPLSRVCCEVECNCYGD